MNNDISLLPEGSEETENNIIRFYVDEDGNKYIKKEDLEKIGNIKFPERTFSINDYEGVFYPVSKELEELITREPFQFVDVIIDSNDVVEEVQMVPDGVSNDTPDGATTGDDAPTDTPAEATTGEGEPTDTPAEATTGDDAPSDTPDGATTGDDAPTDTPDGATTGDDAPTDTPAEATTGDDASTDTPAEATTGDDAPTIRQSDLEYKAMVDAKIAQVSAKLLKFKSKYGPDITGHISTTIYGLELELEELKRISNELGNRARFGSIAESGLAFTDRRRDKLKEKRSQYEQRIAELEALKTQLRGNIPNHIADMRIRRINEFVLESIRRDIFYSKVQRTIMYPRFLIEAKKRNLLTHAQARVTYYENGIRDNEENKAKLDGDSVFNDIRDRIYDIKGIYFEKRLARSRAILEKMQESGNIISMYGARVTSLSKSYLDRIREKNQQTMQTTTSL